MSFRKNWERGRAPGGEKKAENASFGVALAYRNALRRELKKIDAPSFGLAPLAVDDLAVAVAALAEDLHADAGLWRSLEACQQGLFGVPLPMVCHEGSSALETFDERRFRFLLYTLWRCFEPNAILSPSDRGLRALADHASGFFREALPKLPRTSPAADYLGRSNRRGWDVKGKLLWLGTRSFLFRLLHRDYVARSDAPPGEEIGTTDDFLCQECTAWSGLGVVDLLAAALDLPEEDKETLRGWYERHAAVYRIVRVVPDGPEEELLEAVNEVNGETYRIRDGAGAGASPFRPGVFAFGSLVPWRGAWYWSGTQRIVPFSPAGLAEARRNLREMGSFSYRYCRDLELKAREHEAKQRESFAKFHGGDLAVFRDGASAAAAESKRLKLPKLLEGLVGETDQVAIFYHSGEGVEIFAAYGTLLSALETQDGMLTRDERDIVQDFIESDAISPAFVRRVIGEVGIAAVQSIEALYLLPEEANGVEYLLRRFKGCYFRKRYPNLSLRE